MIKHLTKLGNSYAIIIDKPILNLFKITPESDLEITTDGYGIRIETPDNANKRMVKEAMVETSIHYRETFDDLLRFKRGHAKNAVAGSNRNNKMGDMLKLSDWSKAKGKG